MPWPILQNMTYGMRNNTYFDIYSYTHKNIEKQVTKMSFYNLHFYTTDALV